MPSPSASQTSMLFPPQAVAEDTTTTANLDTRGFDYATIIVAMSSETNTSAEGPTISLLTSDLTVVSNGDTVATDQVAYDLTGAGQTTYHVDLRGKKRYLGLSVTAGSHATGDDITISAVAILSRADEAPAGTSGMVSGTYDVAVAV